MQKHKLIQNYLLYVFDGPASTSVCIQGYLVPGISGNSSSEEAGRELADSVDDERREVEESLSDFE